MTKKAGLKSFLPSAGVFLRLTLRPAAEFVAVGGGRIRRGCSRLAIRWLACSIVTCFVPAVSPAARGPLLLQPMTSDQVFEAGAAGTGCSWSLPPDRPMRFAAAEDRAVVRLDGRMIILAPRPNAPELFPFTFKDWHAEGVTVHIQPIGIARRVGTEATTSRATLTIAVQGKSQRIVGALSCGS
ncbi:hypothetical protein [Sphingomonas endolithica]|uniref:hypothetical protein n=1 Tax=Sphingomonas endolithica TaxID=2972485 RepID=UPI0021AF4043|nr:hypothetical protein [Sphingomonas sp. ZFBP2030]